MADTQRFVNTAADAGGNGTTNATSSGDNTHAYQSLTAWEAAEQTTIGAGDRHLVDCTGTAADATNFNIGGWTVTGRLIIQANRSDAAGFYTGALSWSTSHYRLVPSGNTNTIGIFESNVTLDGLQLSAGATAASKTILLISEANNAGVIIQNCRINGNARTGMTHIKAFLSAACSGASYFNNIVYQGVNGLVAGGDGTVTETWEIYNNTVFDFTTGILNQRDDADVTINCKNNVVYNCTTTINLTNTGPVNQTNNAVDVVTPADPDDISMGTDVTDDMVDPENATLTARNVTPIAGGVLINAGIGEAADADVPNDDIIAAVRKDPPDIGAWETPPRENRLQMVISSG